MARALHRHAKFDLVHHVTFASFRQPSFMGLLDIPFMFGPVGGGESTPPRLLRTLSFAGQCTEILRSLGSLVIRWDPLMLITFSRAQWILCTTEETLAHIPLRYRQKCRVQLAVGIDPAASEEPLKPTPAQVRFLFVGRLLCWKGLHLALRAMAVVKARLPDARLRIIGAGKDRRWLELQAQQAGVADMLDWMGSIPHDDMAKEYGESCALVFPSLHDSGGMVVLEAMAAGLPAICLDLAGPNAIVTSKCGIVVPAQDADQSDVVRGLAAAMIRVAEDADLYSRLAHGAIGRVQQLTWDGLAEKIYAPLDQIRETR